MKTFSYDYKMKENGIVIVFKGAINEDADFSKLKGLSHPDIEIDMDGVTALNSTGIRSWIHWLQTLPKASKLRLRGCPRTFIDQVNMMQGLLPPGSIVESFYVPYYCEHSGEEKKVLYRAGIEYVGDRLTHPENIVCDVSNEPMVIDVNISFFRFLRRAA